MAVVNAEDGKVVAIYPTGDHADATVSDSAAKVVFTSTGEGNIYALRLDSPDTYTALATIPTAASSKTMTLDETPNASLYARVKATRCLCQP